MGLQLVDKLGTDEFSFDGSGTDPLSNSVNLDASGTPPTIDSTVLNVELFAQTNLYTGITISVVTEQAGMDYKLSLDNINWFDALTSGAGGAVLGEIDDMDANGGDLRIDVYIKVVTDNDGSVSSGSKIIPDVRLNYTENL